MGDTVPIGPSRIRAAAVRAAITAGRAAARASFFASYWLKRIAFQLRLGGPQFKKSYLNAFPAVHVRLPQWYDYILRFSGEGAVALVTVAITAWSAYSFGMFGGVHYRDGSFAARLLAAHPQLNPKMYAEQVTSRTAVALVSPFVNEASAEGADGASDDWYADDEPGLPVIDDGVMVKPSPDSVAGLIAKQIKIYETKTGDTLSSVAAQNGITTYTLAGANKLTTATQLKPGWQLLVLPTDGALHRAGPNDTLPDLAKKYGVDLDTIISYNALGGAEDIEPDQLYIIPGGRYPEPPKPAAPKTKTPAKPPANGKTNGGGVKTPRQYDVGSGHLFPWGYCTWYVATKVHVPWGGNAKQWLSNARAYGAVITHEPTVGAIVVTTDNRRYGHVALVESVDDDGFTVSEMNYKKFGTVNTRWISRSSGIIRGFILP